MAGLQAAKWPGYLKTLQAHAANLTAVILSPYEMSANASLVDQGGSAAAHAAEAAAVTMRIHGLCAHTADAIAIAL